MNKAELIQAVAAQSGESKSTVERLNALDSAARAAEIEALKQYEQADYDFMRGDAEIPQNQAAE